MKKNLTRRHLALAVGSAVAAAGVVGAASPAAAFQGNMEAALNDLEEALESLREATPNKGGHRARAVALVEQAIAETKAGIAFAAQHGGG